MLSNSFTAQLNIQYPVIQAPMAGGATTSSLVSSVSEAGGLGMIGAGYMTPSQAREQMQELKQQTSTPFGINLFVPETFEVNQKEIDEANQILSSVREKLDIPLDHQVEYPDAEKTEKVFQEHIQVVLEEKVPVCSFTFGIPSKKVIAQLKEHNVYLIGTATTVEEAVENEKAGMDAVVVQGSEAGGHRGSFLDKEKQNLVGLMSLLPQSVDQVSIPVIAAGGIMDARGLLASLSLGAAGVQMGTAFLTCKESGAPDIYKQAIFEAKEDQTAVTRAFSGRWARGIENSFIAEMKNHEQSFPNFPVQNSLTKGIRKASAEQKNKEFMSLWSGQSPRLAQDLHAKDFMKKLAADAEKIKSNW
ncbi:NAD(P)H-dependent flavin oxidoreductase [Alkalicoccus daliensis]|uniref:Probable nitronate monooxygenase n=1 Tax=Alkalicoccus daliensis TaxID=745820 RepID=A0A1H0D8N0_9BACI|nr:nitronate monooxygenase [Alkalicoccus daliensis]SDN66552.1 nitronate monooxygenase [Alkalicoccus daliensis]